MSISKLYCQPPLPQMSSANFFFRISRTHAKHFADSEVFAS